MSTYKRFNKMIIESHETQFQVTELRTLYEVFEGDFTEFSMIYRTFLERTESQMSSLEASIKTGDKKTFARIFHDIHGASSNTALSLISNTLKEIKEAVYKDQFDEAKSQLKLLKIALEDLNDWLAKLKERM